jgi:hypothetical protein
MPDQNSLKGLAELYQGEVIGEVFFDGLMASLADARERYVVGCMLQLETETKARLRPHVLRNGLPLAEDAAARAEGLALASAMAPMNWSGKMQALFSELDTKYVPRYKEIDAGAPQALREVTASMVEHETALRETARREMIGETHHSVDPVVTLLRYPLPKPA